MKRQNALGAPALFMEIVLLIVSFSVVGGALLCVATYASPGDFGVPACHYFSSKGSPFRQLA